MKTIENKLVDGFKSVELEERLEMANLAASDEAAGLCLDNCNFE